MSALPLDLDHNATSPLRPDVAEVLARHLREMPANAGSVHGAGQAARALLENARRDVLRARFQGRGRLVFTSSATESNNLLLRNTGPGPLILSPVDHPSLTRTAEALASAGRRTIALPVTQDGEPLPDALEVALAEGPGATLCVTWVNNELGTIAPLAELASRCLQTGVHLHVDAAQVFGRYDWPLPEGVASCSFGAHKGGGPIGIGALWLRNPGARPRGMEGGYQERGSRPGTEAVWLADALARTVTCPDPRWERLEPLRSSFEKTLVAEGGARVLGAGAPRVPNTTKVVLPEREAEEALAMLDLAGIAASAGSACTAGSIDPSPLVLALGVSKSEALRALRFSFGPEHVDMDGRDIAHRVLTTLALR